MALLTQSSSPRLWSLMKNMVGGNARKQTLATEQYRGQKWVLENGCAIENISVAFHAFPNMTFTGIDINRNAIDLASQRFRNQPTFSISLLNKLHRWGKAFDYVLFAGMLHHIGDNTGIQLLRDAVKCILKYVSLVIYEPEAPNPSDGWFTRYFCTHIDQSAFLLSRGILRRRAQKKGIALESYKNRMAMHDIVKRYYVARFNLLVGAPAEKAVDVITA